MCGNHFDVWLNSLFTAVLSKLHVRMESARCPLKFAVSIKRSRRVPVEFLSNYRAKQVGQTEHPHGRHANFKKFVIDLGLRFQWWFGYYGAISLYYFLRDRYTSSPDVAKDLRWNEQSFRKVRCFATDQLFDKPGLNSEFQIKLTVSKLNGTKLRSQS